MKQSVKKFSQVRINLKAQLRKSYLIVQHLQYLIKPEQEIQELCESLNNLLELDWNIENIDLFLKDFEKLVRSRKITMAQYNKSLHMVKPQTKIGKMLHDLILAMQEYVYESYHPSYLSQRSKSQMKFQDVFLDKWTELREIKELQKQDERDRILDDIERYRESHIKEGYLKLLKQEI